MSASARTTASPFSRAVVNSMRKLYPEALADKSFDNTGLLLESPAQPSQNTRNLALLTIDLTRAVATEAIDKRASIVVAYHPIIFRPLKSLTLRNTQQESLLRLAAAGISVYSPHTAVDAAPGGLSDWLADIVTGTVSGNTATASQSSAAASSKAESLSTTSSASRRPGPGQRQYSRPTYPTPSSQSTGAGIEHKRSTILPSPKPPPSTHESAGIGRLVTFAEAQPLPQLIERIARGVGTPAGFPVAIPQGAAVDGINIRTVAVCAGSGGSVLREGEAGDADLWLTGELSHHEALAVTERGGCVVTLGHSNTERGYLGAVMSDKLERDLQDEWGKARKEWGQEYGDEWREKLEDEDIEIDVSEHDRDPYGIVLLEGSQMEGTRLDEGEVAGGWGAWRAIKGGWRVKLAPVGFEEVEEYDDDDDDGEVRTESESEEDATQTWDVDDTIVADWDGWDAGVEHDIKGHDVTTSEFDEHNEDVNEHIQENNPLENNEEDVGGPSAIEQPMSNLSDDVEPSSAPTTLKFSGFTLGDNDSVYSSEANTSPPGSPSFPQTGEGQKDFDHIGLGIAGVTPHTDDEGRDLTNDNEQAPAAQQTSPKEKSWLKEIEEELDDFLCSPMDRYGDESGTDDGNSPHHGKSDTDASSPGDFEQGSANSMSENDPNSRTNNDVAARQELIRDFGWLFGALLIGVTAGRLGLIDWIGRF